MQTNENTHCFKKHAAHSHISRPFSLSEQVALDLSKKLEEFSDGSKGLTLLSRNMKIHKRTLKRLLNLENTPTYYTLHKIYRYLHGAESDTSLLEKVPCIVRESLLKGNPQESSDEFVYSVDVEKLISSNPICSEIYILCATAPITEEFILFRFGQYGVESLNKMLSLNIIAHSVPKGTFVLGTQRTNFSPEMIKKIGLNLTDKYHKCENAHNRGENHMGFFAEGLSPSAYNEWLKIDEEAFQKKVELSKNKGAKGSIRAFTFMSTDTLVKKTQEVHYE